MSDSVESMTVSVGYGPSSSQHLADVVSLGDAVTFTRRKGRLHINIDLGVDKTPCLHFDEPNPDFLDVVEAADPNEFLREALYELGRINKSVDIDRFAHAAVALEEGRVRLDLDESSVAYHLWLLFDAFANIDSVINKLGNALHKSDPNSGRPETIAGIKSILDEVKEDS